MISPRSFVIARVYEHNGSLETTLWVAPIGRPDDW